jgi:hypothetical protein
MLPLLERLNTTLHNARRLTIGASIVALATLPLTAAAQSWAGPLVGTNEVPPNASPATGYVYMSLTGNSLSLWLNWSGLTGGNVTAGHIHCCTNPGSNVGVAVGFNGLPASTSGSYSATFDLTSLGIYTGAFVNNFGGGTALGAQAALLEGLNSGRAYVNLHNPTFPGGEIRANVVVTPEPASMALMAAGLLATGMVVRRRKRSR